ncbi:hypothetical protein BKA82DRAFT_26894 [Pisolithus tinctorius]|uniref:Uncharacterized protein n=1 Tax=Pisolithus tinctorius Marx 270 TaxID=870435 RepID=A0A0C3P7Z2_PISTI|nr:hypothetical protein BKA82DRAFT_26894 [Pisolithus tinctorius]KIO03584.1 hypothetical protein M404DRAFT_26894 [Pisolithus tinctorius Marx 270]
MSSSSSHKLFKKSPELDAAANHILQIYFKDITESSKLLQIYFKDIVESSKLGKVDKIAKWKGAIKVINDELDAPEWKTALSPSKTDVTNHKWLNIVEHRYDYHWLGLPMPRVMPTLTPPTQETKMPKSNKGKQKATEAEVEQMMVESLHRMEVDNEGEDKVPEKEDEEEEPARGRQKHKAAAKMTSHRSRGRSCSRKATAETNNEDDVPAQGQSKRKPCPPLDGLYGRTALAARRTPSPDPHSFARFNVAMPKAGLPLQLDGIHHKPGEKSELKRHLSMAFKAINAGVGPSNQGETIPEGSSLKIRIPAFKRRDSHPIPAAVVEESMVADTHPSTTAAPIQLTTAATPSAPSPICAPTAKVSQMSNTFEERIEDLECQLCDAEAHCQYYKD